MEKINLFVGQLKADELTLIPCKIKHKSKLVAFLLWLIACIIMIAVFVAIPAFISGI